MERYAIALKINDGKMNDYRRTLGRLSPGDHSISRPKRDPQFQHLECRRSYFYIRRT